MTPDKQGSWLTAFRDFCSYLQIDSKETGMTTLAPNGQFQWGSQERFVQEIDYALQHDKRFIIVNKARQLGSSTISTALDLFWGMVNPGLQGAIITHDEASRDDFRSKIEHYIDSLPKQLKRGIKTSNRYRLEFMNSSVINYMVAGTRKGGSLGRSFALNYCHGTELSTWADEEGLASLLNAFAETYPARLYIFESTARGYNHWHDMWEQAAEDPSQHRFFLGWYLREDQMIPRSDPRFAKLWDDKLTVDETDSLEIIKQRDGIILTPEQLTWRRWKLNTTRDEFLTDQEQPFTAEASFIQSGLPFFSLRQVAKRHKLLSETTIPMKAYRYSTGEDFLATVMEPVYHARYADLRVWQEPDPYGEYAIGADPTYGGSEVSDHAVVEVYRCFADKFIQVAEFCSNAIGPTEFAWIVAHLAGAYKNSRLNLEINGPGEATMIELRHLKKQLTLGELRGRATTLGIEDLFAGVHNYYYTRQDSLNNQLSYFWKTSYENKKSIFNSFKDAFSLGIADLYSLPLVEEMRNVVYNQGMIGAEGRKHDDKVFASCLAHRAYTDWIRNRMITEGRTYEKEMIRVNALREGKPQTFEQVIVEDYFRNSRRDNHVDPTPWYAR